MAQLLPYLHFKGNCGEAMKFYSDCLGATLQMQTMGESPMGADIPKEMHNYVLHSVLVKDGFILMGADMMGHEIPAQGNTMRLCLVCNSKDEIETLFSKLSAGGSVVHPLKEEFFGTYGEITDRFGFSWMFQFGNNGQM